MKALQNKGIILAGGEGSRLHPVTWAVTKQLLPVYDKPLIYYPLSVLILLGIRDVLLIVKPNDLDLYQKVFGDGSFLGLNISYQIQNAPRGLPEAFTLGRDFIGSDPVTMILGDNIFYGSGLINFIKQCLKNHKGATGFSYTVGDPSRFGVVNYDKKDRVLSIQEKPKKSKSQWAITGLYHFDNDVSDKAQSLKPSKRGELEIVDLMTLYKKESRLSIAKMPRGFSWLDTGTSEALMKAGQYVQILEERQGIKIACLEEIAFKAGYLTAEQLEKRAQILKKSAYGDYLFKVLEEGV